MHRIRTGVANPRTAAPPQPPPLQDITHQSNIFAPRLRVSAKSSGFFHTPTASSVVSRTLSRSSVGSFGSALSFPTRDVIPVGGKHIYEEHCSDFLLFDDVASVSEHVILAAGESEDHNPKVSALSGVLCAPAEGGEFGETVAHHSEKKGLIPMTKRAGGESESFLVEKIKGRTSLSGEEDSVVGGSPPRGASSSGTSSTRGAVVAPRVKKKKSRFLRPGEKSVEKTEQELLYYSGGEELIVDQELVRQPAAAFRRTLTRSERSPAQLPRATPFLTETNDDDCHEEGSVTDVGVVDDESFTAAAPAAADTEGGQIQAELHLLNAEMERISSNLSSYIQKARTPEDLIFKSDLVSPKKFSSGQDLLGPGGDHVAPPPRALPPAAPGAGEQQVTTTNEDSPFHQSVPRQPPVDAAHNIAPRAIAPRDEVVEELPVPDYTPLDIADLEAPSRGAPDYTPLDIADLEASAPDFPALWQLAFASYETLKQLHGREKKISKHLATLKVEQEFLRKHDNAAILSKLRRKRMGCTPRMLGGSSSSGCCATPDVSPGAKSLHSTDFYTPVMSMKDVWFPVANERREQKASAALCESGCHPTPARASAVRDSIMYLMGAADEDTVEARRAEIAAV